MTQLEYLRRCRGWTIDDLAKAASVGYHSAWRAENGRPVRVDTLDKLASAVGVDVSIITTDYRTCKRAS